jgi:hypothetical protein
MTACLSENEWGLILQGPKNKIVSSFCSAFPDNILEMCGNYVDTADPLETQLHAIVIFKNAISGSEIRKAIKKTTDPKIKLVKFIHFWNCPTRVFDFVSNAFFEQMKVNKIPMNNFHQLV